MKAILVRIGVDHSYGAWNAPVDPRTGEFVYVPIPDNVTKQYTSGNIRRYDVLAGALAEFTKKCSAQRMNFPVALAQRNMHLDPDFEHLTYGDNGTRRGSGISNLKRDDLLVFYAGLRSIIAPNSLVYALVGLFVVDEVVRAIDVPPERRHENAHTRWTIVSGNDIVVRGKHGLSGRLEHCNPIGEWRDRAYRVCRDVEEAWGGLSVKNGYLQRSAVPPTFLNAQKFYHWFRQQGAVLCKRNN